MAQPTSVPFNVTDHFARDICFVASPGGGGGGGCGSANNNPRHSDAGELNSYDQTKALTNYKSLPLTNMEMESGVVSVAIKAPQ